MNNIKRYFSVISPARPLKSFLSILENTDRDPGSSKRRLRLQAFQIHSWHEKTVSGIQALLFDPRPYRQCRQVF